MRRSSAFEVAAFQTDRSHMRIARRWRTWGSVRGMTMPHIAGSVSEAVTMASAVSVPAMTSVIVTAAVAQKPERRHRDKTDQSNQKKD